MRALVFALALSAPVLLAPTASAQDTCWVGDCQNGPGWLQRANGSHSQGIFRNGRLHGRGMESMGSAYQSGWWVDGVLQRGELTMEDGTQYTGTIGNGRFHGFGKLTATNGVVYIGPFVDGKKHGEGLLVFSSGRHWQGTFRDGSREGRFRVWSPGNAQGRQYTFTNDQESAEAAVTVDRKAAGPVCVEGDCENGTGRVDYPQTSHYVGAFANGQPSGQGRYVTKDSTVYAGTFAGGAMTQGTIRWMSGETFEGTTADNAPVQGTLRFSSGRTYTGPFVDGQPSGTGTILYEYGHRYDGPVVQMDRQGAGTLAFGNGYAWRGTFVNDQATGSGSYVDAQGRVVQQGPFNIRYAGPGR